MKKERFNFDKLMDVINYYDVQRDFITVGEDGKLNSFDFRTFDEMGVDEDNYPYNFKEFLKHNIKLDKIVLCAEDHAEPMFYWFEDDEGFIAIDGEKFTMKEALTIINLVMEHQRLNKRWCHNVTFGKNGEERTVYAQESTAFGLWWNDFLEFYQENVDNIDMIYIELGICEKRSIDITLLMKEKDKQS